MVDPALGVLEYRAMKGKHKDLRGRSNGGWAKPEGER
jgi:hypothetical protein